MIRTRLVAALALLTAGLAGPAARACSGPPAMSGLAFGTPSVIDPVRAGGEPSVFGLADGTLLYSSHAGTTQYRKSAGADPDFVVPYDGSTYVWRSENAGDTWQYVGLAGTGVGPHAGPGFSDPTIAADSAGNVYVAGIDLVNVYVAKSADSGKTWLWNPAATLNTDREWLAADQPNVVYLNGNEIPRGRLLWKSTDGGLTWNWATPVRLGGSGPPSPITVDQSDGRLYFPGAGGSTVAVYPNARSGNFTRVTSSVSAGLPHAHGFLNPSAVDAAGNVYIVSNTNTDVRVASSTDRGLTWTTVTVYHGTTSLLWPWISAGADGRVGVSWLQADESAGNLGSVSFNYRVYAAQTLTGHGYLDDCGAHPPVWSAPAAATPSPIHTGGICESGLNCQLSTSLDRRLGDYHTNSITADGRLVIAYGETASKPNGAISHPGFVRQSGGVDFYP